MEAFRRLVDTLEFKSWHKIECARRMGQPIVETEEQILARVDKMIESGIRDGLILVEYDTEVAA